MVNWNQINGIEKEDFLRLVLKRVASVSVGASTLRNQGEKGMVEIARKFLAGLDLTALKGVTAEQFRRWLTEQTDVLSGEFTGKGKGNWGAARKAINVFLVECLLNGFLAEEYALDRVAEFMETPLDNPAAERIKKESRGIGFHGNWKGIKNLDAVNSALFQERALALASRKGIPRGFLDLWLWRGDSNESQL